MGVFGRGARFVKRRIIPLLKRGAPSPTISRPPSGPPGPIDRIDAAPAEVTQRKGPGPIVSPVVGRGAYRRLNGVFSEAEFLRQKLGDKIVELEIDDQGMISLVMGRTTTDSDLLCLQGLKHLQKLDLLHSQVSDAGLEHLISLRSLQRLHLIGAQVSDAGLPHLAQLTSLEDVDLSGTQVSDAGLPDLVRLTFLRNLYLSNTQVSDAGLPHFARLIFLQRLDLSLTQVSDAGLEDLTSLKYLNLEKTEVSLDGANRLEKTIPGLVVKWFPKA